MKNERGITMITLVLVIILMLILTTTGVFTGIDAYKTMKTQTFIAQMKVVREKINIIKEEYKAWDKYDGTNIYEYIDQKYAPKRLKGYNAILEAEFLDIINSKTNIVNEKDVVSDYYFYFPAADLESILGLSNLDINIIINFETGTFVEHDGVEATTIFGKTTEFYVLDELLAMQSANFNPTAGTGGSGSTEIEELKIVEASLLENSKNKTRVKLRTNKLYDETIQEIRVKSALNSSVDVVVSNFEKTNTSIEFEIDSKLIGTFVFEVTDNTGSIKKSPTLEVIKVNEPYVNIDATKVMWDISYIEGIATSDIDWYNYSSRSRKWANIKLADGSYYVWIPRFAYCIKDGNIDIKFINGNGKITFDGVDIENDLTDDYKIPTAFTVSSNYENGEFDKELTGIWVSKYECTVEKTDGIDKPTYMFKSVPFKSLSMNADANFFALMTNVRNIERYLDIYEFGVEYGGNRGSLSAGYIYENTLTEFIDVHLIKNSEWAALAYLTYSEYGSSGNLIYNKYSVTGGAEGAFGEEAASLSSTKNMHGVFDLNNNKPEFVAAGASSLLKTVADVGTSSNKYITFYADNKETSTVLTEDSTKLYGDAMVELKNTGIVALVKQYIDYNEGNVILTRGGTSIFDYTAVSSDATTINGDIGVRIVWTFE